MQRTNKKSSSGSALVVVLALLAMIGLAAAAWTSSTLTGLQMRSNIRNETSLKFVAEGGINLAKNDLWNRVTNSDFHHPPREGKFTNTIPACASYAACVGLIVGTSLPSYPRLDTTDGDIRLSLSYSPSEKNPGDPTNASDPDHDSFYPKTFQVTSKAENVKNGKAYTVESVIQLREIGLTELAFGILKPTVPQRLYPGRTLNTGQNERAFRFWMLPAIYDGTVYFGDFGSLRPWFDEQTSDDLINQVTHEFRGPVLFKNAATINWNSSSTRDEDTKLNFKQGYKTGYNLDTDSDSAGIFAELQSQATVTLPGERCLTLNENTIRVFECNDDWTSARDRYDTTVLLDTITITGPTVIYSDFDIEARGILHGQVTIATKRNFRIGGDIQYKNQGYDSTDRLGVVAGRNIVVPYYVPVAEKSGYEANRNTALHGDYDSVTNFVVTNDRDLSDPDYDLPYGTPTPLPHSTGPNKTGSLDIDATLVAIGNGDWRTGILDVEGLNNYPLDATNNNNPDTNAINGITMLGDDRVPRSLDPGNPIGTNQANYYYRMNFEGEVNWRRAAPMFCRSAGINAPVVMNAPDVMNAPVVGSCPFRNELPRQPMDQIWIYGGLVTRGYSKINNRFGSNPVVGFARKVIHFDNRHLNPPAFPDSTRVELLEISRKSYAGSPEILAQR